MTMGRDQTLKTDEAVEALLEQATPRPVPPDAETAAVRAAVRAEWRQVTGRRRSRQRWTRLAVAASVLAAVFLSLNQLRTTGVAPATVASIDNRFGTIHVVGEDGALESGNDLSGILAGQSLVTDDASGLALSWGTGGSLRIDADTRIEFVSADRVYLRSGRVYFDSEPTLASASRPDARLTIATDFGDVTHVGTQYMARAGRELLTVSVRRGEVIVRGDGFTETAGRHLQMAISGSGTSSIVNIRPYGEAWAWVERTSPSIPLDGRSVDQFLEWVSHETGLEIRYESSKAEAYARREILNGILEAGPRRSLETWMLGTDLAWRIEEGVIYVDHAQ
jgi:ferric-dicitrate binding protein FerR (iron transport regulator)